MFTHLLMPAVGATIVGFVTWIANIAAQRLGFVWIGLGLLVLLGMYNTGRRRSRPVWNPHALT